MSLMYGKHCTHCGTEFDIATWPRTCPGCSVAMYANPIPVAVGVVPVFGPSGIVIVRRGIQPSIGEWALPGGYINFDETWQEACVREVFEEVGAHTNGYGRRPFDVHTTKGGKLLIFGVSAPITREELDRFVPNEEVTEVSIMRGPETLAFPTHTEVALRYFDGH